MKPEPRPCLGACGSTVKRVKSLPLCKPCSARAWSIFKARHLTATDWQREYSRFYGSPETVATALAGA